MYKFINVKNYLLFIDDTLIIEIEYIYWTNQTLRLTSFITLITIDNVKELYFYIIIVILITKN